MEPNVYATRIPDSDHTSKQLIALRATMLQMTTKLTETRLAFNNLVTSVDNLSTTDVHLMDDAISRVFTTVDTAFTMFEQLDDHIQIANNRLVNITTSTTDNNAHAMPTTVDTRKRLYDNSNHGQQPPIAKKKGDSFLTTDTLAARALAVAIQTLVGSDMLGRALVHDIVRAEFITDTLSLEQNTSLKYILHVDDAELLKLESGYQATSSHNPYYIANSMFTVKHPKIHHDVRVTPHSKAVKVGLKHMWSMLPQNSIQSASSIHRILMTAIQHITEKLDLESDQVTNSTVMAFVAGTIMHENVSYQDSTIFGGAAYREPMDDDDKNAYRQYSHNG
jgi:hypothetical protein